MGRPLFIQDMSDVLINHIGPSKRVCSVLVFKKGLVLGDRGISWVWGCGGAFEDVWMGCGGPLGEHRR